MLVGVKPVISTGDPFVGFSKASPLMMEIEASTGPRMVTRPGKLIWFNRQLFDKQKKPNTKRVFCLGGSTTFGRPYADSTSFCGWMREILPLVDSTVDWQVINAGGVSYASYRVATVMEELANYQPDIFVVYCGHNEFLEDRTYANMRSVSQTWMKIQSAASNLRTYTLIRRLVESARANSKAEDTRDILSVEVDERLNKTIGPVDYHRDPTWFANVVQHYRFNLERMIEIAKQAGATVVFIMPAANELDSDPFKAEPGPLSPAEKKALEEQLSLASEASANGDLALAIEHLQTARDLDPLDASISYELGVTQFDEKKFEDASVELKRAINEDVCPLRAPTAITQALRAVAQENEVTLVDFDTLLRNKSKEEYGYAILGNQYFLDHVHPNIEIHRELALWTIEALASDGLVNKFDRDEDFQSRLQDCIADVEAGIDQEQHGIALRNLAKVMHWSGKFEIAADRASDALDLIRNDAESRFVLADCLKNLGRPYDALTQYEFLKQDHPDYWRAFTPYGELLMDVGHLEESADMLAAASLVDAENPYLHLTIGRLFMKQRRWEDATSSLLKSLEMYGGEDEEIEALVKECRRAMGQSSVGELPGTKETAL